MTTTGEMRIIDKTGDTKIIWDKDNADEAAAAKKVFDDLKKKKFMAYKVDDHGDKSEVIREFDPNAEKLIMSPPLVGG